MSNSNVTGDAVDSRDQLAISKKSSVLIASCMMLMMFAGIVKSAEFKLAVQPVLPPAEIKQHYAPLAQYLSEATGHNITLSTFISFKSYYSNMKRKKGFDLVLDAAHFTNYRADKMQYNVLAKLPDTVSFSLVTGPDLLVFDAEELIPYKVATMISPAVGGLRLKELYPNRDNRPTIVRAMDSVDAVMQVKDGRADAAMVPTPLVGQYEFLNTVMTTDPIPHMAMSASPELPQDVADKVKQALIDAGKTAKGKKMLSDMKFQSFVNASNEEYQGYANLLEAAKHNKPVLTRANK